MSLTPSTFRDRLAQSVRTHVPYTTECRSAYTHGHTGMCHATVQRLLDDLVAAVGTPDREALCQLFSQHRVVVSEGEYTISATMHKGFTDAVMAWATGTGEPQTETGKKSNPMDEAFQRQLEALLNRYCQENASNTPDFILAEYLRACLVAFNIAARKREDWYGHSHSPRPKAT